MLTLLACWLFRSTLDGSSQFVGSVARLNGYLGPLVAEVRSLQVGGNLSWNGLTLTDPNIGAQPYQQMLPVSWLLAVIPPALVVDAVGRLSLVIVIATVAAAYVWARLAVPSALPAFSAAGLYLLSTVTLVRVSAHDGAILAMLLTLLALIVIRTTSSKNAPIALCALVLPLLALLHLVTPQDIGLGLLLLVLYAFGRSWSRRSLYPIVLSGIACLVVLVWSAPRLYAVLDESDRVELLRLAGQIPPTARGLSFDDWVHAHSPDGPAGPGVPVDPRRPPVLPSVLGGLVCVYALVRLNGRWVGAWRSPRSDAAVHASVVGAGVLVLAAREAGVMQLPVGVDAITLLILPSATVLLALGVEEISGLLKPADGSAPSQPVRRWGAHALIASAVVTVVAVAWSLPKMGFSVTDAPDVLARDLYQAVVTRSRPHEPSMTDPPLVEVLAPDRVDVHWSDVPGDDGYVIEGRGAAAEFVPLARTWSDQTRLPVLGLTPGETYVFQLRACKGDRCGEPSPPRAVRLPVPWTARAQHPVGPPLQVWIIPTGPDRVEIAWDTVPGAQEYRIELDLGDGGGFSEVGRRGGGEPLYELSGLPPDPVYLVRVRSCGEEGCTAPSAAVPLASPPGSFDQDRSSGAVNAVRVENGLTRLTWDPYPGAEHYEIEMRVTGADAMVQPVGRATAPATAYDVGGLDPTSTYGFRVRACAGAVCSPPSAFVWDGPVDELPDQVIVPRPRGGAADDALTPPQTVWRAGDDPSPSFAWSPVDGAETYRVEVFADGVSWSRTDVPAATTTFSVSRLTPGHRYQIRVRTCRDDRCSVASPTLQLVPPAPPPLPAPTGLAAQQSSAAEVQLAWEPVDGADEYRIELSGGMSREFVEVARVTGADTSLYPDDLVPNTPYRMRVRACRDGRCSRYSVEHEFVRDVLLPPVRFWPPAEVSHSLDSRALVMVFLALAGLVLLVVARSRGQASVPHAVLLWLLSLSPMVEAATTTDWVMTSGPRAAAAPVGARVTAFMPRDWLRVPELAEVTAAQERFASATVRAWARCDLGGVPSDCGQLVANFWGIRVANISGGTLPRRVAQLPWRVRSPLGEDGLPPGLLAMLNVGHVIRGDQDLSAGGPPQTVTALSASTLQPAPRTFFAANVTAVSSPEQARAALFPAGVADQPLDPPVRSVAEGLQVSRSFSTEGRIDARFARDRVEITLAPSADERFLVVNELFHPAWRATIDGARAPILPTNVVMQGVQVPAGASQVVFQFVAGAGETPAVVFAVTALGLLAIGVWGLRPGERSQRRWRLVTSARRSTSDRSGLATVVRLGTAILMAAVCGFPALLLWWHDVSPVVVAAESIGYRYFWSIRVLAREDSFLFMLQGQTPGLVQHGLVLVLDLLQVPFEALRARLELYSYLFLALNLLLLLLTIVMAFISRQLTHIDRMLVAITAIASSWSSRWALFSALAPDYYATEAMLAVVALVVFLLHLRSGESKRPLMRLLLLGLLVGLMAGTKVTLVGVALVMATPTLLAAPSPIVGMVRAGVVGAIAAVTFVGLTLGFYLFDWSVLVRYAVRWPSSAAGLGADPAFWASIFRPDSLVTLGWSDNGYILMVGSGWLIVLAVGLAVDARRRRSEWFLPVLAMVIMAVALAHAVGLSIRGAASTLFEFSLFFLMSSSAVIASMKSDNVQRMMALGFTTLIGLHCTIIGGLNARQMFGTAQLTASTQTVWEIHDWIVGQTRPVVFYLPTNDYSAGLVEEVLLKGASDRPTWNITSGRWIIDRLAPDLSFTQTLREVVPGSVVMWVESANLISLTETTPALREALEREGVSCRQWDLRTYPWWERTVRACTVPPAEPSH
jgi:hypothetical protein